MIWWGGFVVAMCSLGTKIVLDKIYVAILWSSARILGLCTKITFGRESNSRFRLITDRGDKEPYLLRHYIFLKDRNKFPFNIFLHRFEKGDEADLHDHPWGFFHVILSGGYWEHVTVNEDGKTLDQGVKRVWRSPGYWNVVGSSYKHRVELGSEKPWTIFIPFCQEHDGRFWVKQALPAKSNKPVYTWYHHERYLEMKSRKTDEDATKSD